VLASRVRDACNWNAHCASVVDIGRWVIRQVGHLAPHWPDGTADTLINGMVMSYCVDTSHYPGRKWHTLRSLTVTSSRCPHAPMSLVLPGQRHALLLDSG
jgi:hypothetical protein